MNIFTAFILFTGITYYQGTMSANDGSFIGEFAKESPAQDAGLLIGDEIIMINGQEVFSWNDLVDILQPIPNSKVDIEVKRGDEYLDFSFDTYEILRPTKSGIDTVGV